MPSKCGKCKVTLKEDEDCVGSDYCPEWYHLTCAKITKQRHAELTKANKENSLKWSCKNCTSACNQAPLSSQDNSSTSSQDVSLAASNFNELKNMLRGINSNVEKLDTKVSNLEITFTQQFNLHIAETNTRIINVQKDVSNNANNIEQVERELKMVQSQLHNLNRINNQCCLNFFAIPQSPTKDYDRIIINKIAAHYNIQLDDRSIQYCSRLSGRKTSLNDTARHKIPPIMVRFANRELANDLMDRYFKAEHPLKLSDVSDVSINSRVFIGEHLTPHALRIYRECTRLKYRKFLTKAYTRGGNIFIHVTADKTSRPLKIDSLELLRLKLPHAYITENDATMANTASGSQLSANGTI